MSTVAFAKKSLCSLEDVVIANFHSYYGVHLTALRTTVQFIMIVSFKHKGLRKLFETGSAAGVQAAHARRLTMQLTALHTAQTIDDMDIHGFRLHSLKGTDAKRWSIWVNGNWRVTFEFVDGNVYVIDYEDYH